MIRELVAGDGETWRAIRLEALMSAPEAFSAKYKTWKERPLSDFEAQVTRGGIFVAEEAGIVLGVACLEPDDDPKRRTRGWVMSVFMRPEARGRGIAVSLIRSVVAKARQCGMQELFLDVRSSNMAAIRVYKKVGFAELEAQDRPEGSDAACEVTMRLVL